MCSSDLVSFAVLLLDFTGGLEEIAFFTSPFFELLGLPGVAAIVLITSIFTNIYSVIAVLTMRSEERRVGKEYRSRWSRYHEKKKKKS